MRDQHKILALSHLGITFALVVGGSVFLGLKADEWWDTSPWFVLLGFLVGFVAGFYHLISTVFRQGDDGAPDQDGDSETGSGSS